MDRDSFDRLIKLMIVLYSRYDPEQGTNSMSGQKVYKALVDLFYDFAKSCSNPYDPILVGSKSDLSNTCTEALNVQKILILQNERNVLKTAPPEIRDSSWAQNRIETIEADIVSKSRKISPPIQVSRDLFGDAYPEEFYPEAVRAVNKTMQERADRAQEKARVKKERDDAEGEQIAKELFGPLWKTYKPANMNGDAYLVDEEGNEQKMIMGPLGPVFPKSESSLNELERMVQVVWDCPDETNDYGNGEDY